MESYTNYSVLIVKRPLLEKPPHLLSSSVMEHSNNTRVILSAVGGRDTGHKLEESIVAVIARELKQLQKERVCSAGWRLQVE